MHISIHQKGLLLTAVGVLFIVPDSLFVRMISTDPLVNSFWRSLVAGLFIAFWLIIHDRKTSIKTVYNMGYRGWLYCAIIASTSPAFVLAISNTSVANVVFIFAAMPIFTAAFSWFYLNEKISARTGLTMIIVMGGLSVIAYGSKTHQQSHWVGDAFALYISLIYGLAFTILRKMKNVSMVPAVPVAFIGSAVLIGMFINPLDAFIENGWLYLCHGLFIALGTSLMTLGPRYLSAPEVSLLILLESVLAPILVWFTLDENPGNWALLGGAIVIGALTISNIIAFKKGK